MNDFRENIISSDDSERVRLRIIQMSGLDHRD